MELLEKKLKGKYDLLYSDTDSLVYHVRIKNLNKWFLENGNEFGLSEMSGEFESDKNTNVLGKFKSEVGSEIITEFVALSPKSYCYKYCLEEIKKAKGVALAISEKQWILPITNVFWIPTKHRHEPSMASGGVPTA